MEHIGRAARLQLGYHVGKRLEQELIEGVPFDGIVLNGQAVRGFKGHAVGGISQDEISLPAAHQRGHILCRSGVAAHQPVAAYSPDVAPLDKGCLLQGGGQVKAVIMGLRFRQVGEHGGQLLLIKAGREDILSAGGDFGQQGRQLLIVPFAGDFVESNVQPLFVHLGQVNHTDLALLYAQVQKDAQPLVAADHIPCAAVPYDGLHVPEGQNGRFQFLISRISGLQGLAGIICCRVQF